MWYKIKQAIYRFMQGRNGVDELGRAQNMICIVLILVQLFVRTVWMSLLVWAAIIWLWFRMVSKNIPARQRENQWYLKKRYAVQAWIQKKKTRAAQRKTHCFYRCKGCGQTIRVPKGKGKIEIRCPKCQYTFIKRT